MTRFGPRFPEFFQVPVAIRKSAAAPDIVDSTACKVFNLGVKRIFTAYRDLAAKELNPSQITKAQAMAQVWMAAFEKRKKK